MKEKVIFDTNTIRNPEMNNFLGNRIELEQFSHVADIVIPFVAIEEIKRQKRNTIKSKKDSFIGNPFHNLFGLQAEITKAFDIEAYIEKLLLEETFKFEIIDLKSNEVLPQIKELALLKKPPFEESDNTDKGFKDALIYFSVLEYLQEVENKYVFVCAKDNRLGDAFKDHPNIFYIKNYEEFKQFSITQFFDDYFIQKLNDELGTEIKKENIKEYWININDNKVVLIEYEGDELVIETDSGEIINSIPRGEYSVLIDALVNSTSFNQTDEVVAELVSLKEFFNNEEILKILNASWKNNQIRWIIDKPQIRELLGPLYVSRKEIIDDEEVKSFLKEKFE